MAEVKVRPSSSKPRQNGTYEAPVLAEPKGGPIPKGSATHGVRHMPGKHNQQTHGNDTGAAKKAVKAVASAPSGRQRFKSGRGAFGSNDIEANAMIVDGPNGRVVRLGIAPVDDEDGEWDGDPDRSDTVSINRRTLRRLRNDLDDGAKVAKAKADALGDDEADGPLAGGEAGGVSWAMHDEGESTFSTEVRIDPDGDGVVLDPKQLARFIRWLDDLDGQLA